MLHQNGVLFDKHRQLYIILYLHNELMTEAVVAMSVMQLATARTVLTSNPSRGTRLSPSTKRPDLLLGPSGKTLNLFRGFLQGGQVTGM